MKSSAFVVLKMAQRGKGRGNNAMAFAGDYIALGAKGGAGGAKRQQQEGAGGPQMGHQGGQSGPSTSSGSGIAAKKSKTGPGIAAAPHPLGWESLAASVDPPVDAADLARAVMAAADEDGNDHRTAALLCASVRQLRGQRAKPDQTLYLSLLFLAKSHPHLFASSDAVVDAFVSLLKRDVKESYKSKGNALVSVLAANVLMSAFAGERNWPEIFVRVYIDDAMGERVWVDHPDCKGFVDNIVTAFGTKTPSAAASQSFYPAKPGESASASNRECASPPVGGGSSGPGSGSATPTRVPDDDPMDTTGGGSPLNLADASSSNVEQICQVQARYHGMTSATEHLVMEIVREQLGRRQGTDNITRNFLKFLTSACGLAEVHN